MYKRLPMLVLVVAVLSIVGCGGSSKTVSSNTSPTNTGSTSTSTNSSATTNTVSTTAAVGPPLSRSQLVTKADAICQRLNTELNAGSNVVRTQADIIRVASQRFAMEQAALVELSKLKPPSSMAHDYQQILAARQVLVEDIKKLGEDAAVKNVRAQAPIYKSSSNVLSQMTVTAQRNGFKHCGVLG